MDKPDDNASFAVVLDDRGYVLGTGASFSLNEYDRQRNAQNSAWHEAVEQNGHQVGRALSVLADYQFKAVKEYLVRVGWKCQVVDFHCDEIARLREEVKAKREREGGVDGVADIYAGKGGSE